MTNYFGFITLIAGLCCVWHLDRKIENTQPVISDFVETEINRSYSIISGFDLFDKRRKHKDSITKELIQLYTKVKAVDPYSSKEREKIRSLLNYCKEEVLNIPNITLLNEYFLKYGRDHITSLETPNYFLIIDRIRHLQNDSFEVEIIPTRLVKDNSLIEYYYEGQLISKDELKNLPKDISTLKAKITNPATGLNTYIKAR